jgi:hypothetical protein
MGWHRSVGPHHAGFHLHILLDGAGDNHGKPKERREMSSIDDPDIPGIGENDNCGKSVSQ